MRKRTVSKKSIRNRVVVLTLSCGHEQFIYRDKDPQDYRLAKFQVIAVCSQCDPDKYGNGAVE